MEDATWLAWKMQEERPRARDCEQPLDPAKGKEMHSSQILQKEILLQAKCYQTAMHATEQSFMEIRVH